jgi:hypothetical protein
VRGFWNIMRLILGVITGLLIVVVAIVATFAFDLFAEWMDGLPGVGPAIVENASVFEYPAGRVLFPAMGIFIIVWVIALALRHSWARIVGIALNLLAVAYLIALAILLIPFMGGDFFVRYRWLILILWLGLLAIFGYQAYSLIADRETERSFAAPFVGQPVVAACDRCGTRLDQRGRCPKCEPAAPPEKEAQPAKGEVVASPKEGSSAPQKKEAAPRVLARLTADGKVYEIAKPMVTIGRDPKNDIVLEDPTVSGRHAEIMYQQGQFGIRDVGSRNGTMVNGTKIEKSRLESGARIEFGRMRLTFEIVKS